MYDVNGIISRCIYTWLMGMSKFLIIPKAYEFFLYDIFLLNNFLLSNISIKIFFVRNIKYTT